MKCLSVKRVVSGLLIGTLVSGLCSAPAPAKTADTDIVSEAALPEDDKEAGSTEDPEIPETGSAEDTGMPGADLAGGQNAREADAAEQAAEAVFAEGTAEPDTMSENEIPDESMEPEQPESEADTTVLPEETDSETAAPLLSGSGDRIYFYNMAGTGLNRVTGEQDTSGGADCIIVESNGHFGLIDAGHSFEDTVTDQDGTVYESPNHKENGAFAGLSSQVEGKNGADAAKYLYETLGVRHLDFVIATHSHSDHIGGMPGIAQFSYTDDAGSTKYLIDSSTVYFEKPYQSVWQIDDDLSTTASVDGWHNQAFYYQADRAMRQRGAVIADITGGYDTSTVLNRRVNYTSLLNRIRKPGLLTDVSFRQGQLSDCYDDRITFQFQNLQISLYNLYETENAANENVNSIATVITDGKIKVFTAGDLDAEWYTEQKIAHAVADDFGTMDLVKASHHGAPRGSNTKEFIDTLRPLYMAETDLARTENRVGAFSAAMYYAIHKGYTRAVYRVGASGRALVAELKADGLHFMTLSGEREEASFSDADSCVNRLSYPDGWYTWDVEYLTGSQAKDYIYMQDSQALTGWNQIEEGWYYMDADGIVQTDTFIEKDGQTVYLGADGRMQSGWRWIDGKWYYLNPYLYLDGEYEIDGALYRFDKNGVMMTGWYEEKTDWNQSLWYYYRKSGEKATAWEQVGSAWYYFDENGLMYPGGIHRIDDKLYLFSASGARIEGDVIYRQNTDSGDYEIYDISADGSLRTGWQYDGGYWYYFNPVSGKALKNGARYISSYGWYLFDAYGKMITGSGWGCHPVTEISGSDSIRTWYWYYFQEDGSNRLQTGWLEKEGKWYYLNPRMVNGWCSVDNRNYFFGASGAWEENPKGWIEIPSMVYVNGKREVSMWYYFTDTGNPYGGWVKSGSAWYYCYYGNDDYHYSSNGRIAQNTCVYSGRKWYALDRDGKWITKQGWVALGSGKNPVWVYVNADGTLKTGWFLSGGVWYYLQPQMVSNTTKKIDGSYYGFDRSGVMKTGWFRPSTAGDAVWYYFNANGSMYYGWLKTGGKWYYLDQDYGYMYEDGTYYIEPDKKYAVFDPNGVYLRYE